MASPSDEAWTSPRPLSGPGTSRQTRRLKLRNAGFRAAAVPPPLTSPRPLSASSAPFSPPPFSPPSLSSLFPDGENVSPEHVLHDIDNSATVRLHRHTPSRSAMMSPSKTVAAELCSPASASPRSATRPRNSRSRTSIDHTRRSGSIEARKYVEHLENELVAAQAKLSALNSPSVTREHSAKIRILNTERKALQEELADWEAKYEKRVEEAVEEHAAREVELRSRMRALEYEAEEARYRAQELEAQLGDASMHLIAAETANVNLEKRIEIMSELLAASPAKIDLHARVPGRARQPRPLSMQPRFPTAGSLASPDRSSVVGGVATHMSPSLSSIKFSPALPSSPDRFAMTQDPVSDAESALSVESRNMHTGTENPWAFQPPSSARSQSRPMRRMRRFGAGSVGPKPLILPSNSQCGSLPASAHALDEEDLGAVATASECGGAALESRSPLLVARPRRSTVAEELPAPRFPSSATQILADTVSESAAGPMFSPAVVDSPVTARDMLSGSTAAGVRNTGTSPRNLMDELAALGSSWAGSSTGRGSSVGFSNFGGAGDDTPGERPLSPFLYSSPFDYDIGLGLRTHFSTPDFTLRHRHRRSMSSSVASLAKLDVNNSGSKGLPRHVSAATQIALARSASRNSHLRASSSAHHKSSSAYRRSPLNPYRHTRALTAPSGSLNPLRAMFGDLWTSPVAVTQHLVRTAQARMNIPGPLLTVQWWLVGILLGPMAKRRLLGPPSSFCAQHSTDMPSSQRPRDRRALTSADASASLSDLDSDFEFENDAVDPLCYGTLYRTPGSSPTRLPHTDHAAAQATRRGSCSSTSVAAKSLVAGTGKKRAPAPCADSDPHATESNCLCGEPHPPARSRHSPWLWLQFSLTLAMAVGMAFRNGPEALLLDRICVCGRPGPKSSRPARARPARTSGLARKASVALATAAVSAGVGERGRPRRRRGLGL